MGYQQAAEKALLEALPKAPHMPFTNKRTGKAIAVKEAENYKNVLGKSVWLKGTRWCCTRSCPTISDRDAVCAASGPLQGDGVGVCDQHAGQAVDDGVSVPAHPRARRP